MKKFVLGSVALAAMVAGPAMAAELPVKAPPPAPTYYDWTGVYIGASIGWARPEVTREYAGAAVALIPGPTTGFVPAVSSTSSSNETIYDVHAGAQVQWGWLILGAEAGYSAGFREMQSTALLPNPPFTGCGVAGCLAFNKITNIFTAGPRLGIAWDRWMFFGTGGYAAGSIKGTYTCVATGILTLPGPGCTGAATTVNDSGTSWNDGWFAGVGFDYMIYKGVLVDAILGAEYQHIDLTQKSACCAFEAPFVFDHKARADIVRARLTIKTHAWDFLR
jgi:outer membrane immunogenic protein